MKEVVRRRALELGFDDCRFTTAKRPESAAEFEQWLSDRRHGEMGYLERNAYKRVDPQKVLPGARSIVILAASYTLANNGKFHVSSSSAEAGPGRPFSGLVAR